MERFYGETPRLVGEKQCKRAIKEGRADVAFLAEDAEERVRLPIESLCYEQSVTIKYVPTMLELGRICGINVGASVAVLLKV